LHQLPVLPWPQVIPPSNDLFCSAPWASNSSGPSSTTVCQDQQYRRTPGTNNTKGQREKKIQTNREGTKLRGQEKNRGRQAGEAGGRDGETEPGERKKTGITQRRRERQRRDTDQPDHFIPVEKEEPKTSVSRENWHHHLRSFISKKNPEAERRRTNMRNSQPPHLHHRLCSYFQVSFMLPFIYSCISTGRR